MDLICTLSTWDKLQNSNERNKIPSEHIDPGVWTSVHASPFLKDLPSLASESMIEMTRWWRHLGSLVLHPSSVISVRGPGLWQPDSPGASGVRSNYIHYLKEARSLTFSVHNKTSVNTLNGHRVVSRANQCHCPTRKIIYIDVSTASYKQDLFFILCVCLPTCM